ncbi:MAG: T9SS type A sorting domain-containing protein [Saprospiraceae bacterium]|nr:T9SS type A sorting domain-containing protein [Saprospiraceae bacterium]
MKNLTNLLLGLCLALTFNVLFAQTKHTDFLKSKPAIDKETPDWAVMMYSKNPHVPTLDSLYQVWRTANPTEKTVHTQNYKKWRRAVEKWLDTEGYITKLSEYDESLKIKPQLPQAEGLTGNWTIVGPVESYEKNNVSNYDDRHANVYSMDIYDVDANILYCGTESGGIFKTTDKGVNWTYLTKDYSIKSVQAIKINPTNSNIVFAAESSTLYRTTDGGTSWQTVYSGSYINEIVIHPTSTNIVMIATSGGIYRSTANGDNGSFTTNVLNQDAHDLKFKTDDPSVVFALADDSSEKITKFYKSTNSGASFSVRSNGWLSLNTIDNPLSGRAPEGGRMAVTPANSSRIYAYLIGETKGTDNGHIGLWKTDDAGENWTLVSPQVGAPYSSTNLNLANYAPTTGGSFWQGFYNLAIMASPTNADHLLLGNLSLYRSTNAGATMTGIGGYVGSTGIHPDFQAMAAKGSDAWLACDGGMTYSTDFFAADFQVRQNGVIASDYWGFGQGWNQDIMVGGRYHNGNAVLSSNYPTGKSITLGGGEAPTGYVNPSTNVAYFSDIDAKSLPTDFNGSVSDMTNWSKYPNESYYAAYSSDAEYDPRYYKHIYLGEGKSLWKSTDNGVTFTELKNFDNGSSECAVRDVEVSRSNPSVIYVHVKTAYSDAALYRSADGGATWTTKAFPVTPNKRHGAISMSATDENKLWAIFSNGSNGNKVYQTNDGGTTWTNITSAVLDGQSLQTVLNQAGTDDVYVGSGNAVFRYSGGSWSNFSTGLPSKTDCNLLRGYYRTNKLRVSTYGNGIWETDFAIASPPVAQPMVDKNTTDCGRTIFQFDDYSVAKSDATYSWSFSPTPQYVSSTTIRNPQVIFGGTGNYSVTLTVTDGNGTSTKSIPNMVTITTDNCALATTPTSTGTFTGSASSYARASAAPNFGASQDFTIAFWLKTTTTSSDAAMATDKNWGSGGYNGWVFSMNSGRVWFNIGDDEGHRIDLYSQYGLNDGKWHHVAASVTRTGNAVLYVDGVNKASTSAAALLTINSSYPLCFVADGLYNYPYAGDIDEVKIWNTALSQSQIRERMYLTATTSESNLINYFQFNDATTNEYDRGTNGYNLTFSASASRSTSTVPVGSGSVYSMSVTSGGIKDFTGTNCQIEFPASGTYPNGDIVVSALTASPDQNPSSGTPLSNKYWVVSNYGSNSTFSALTSIKFGDLGSFATGSASNFKLYKRNSNAHGATWGSSVDAADVLSTTNNNTLTFSTGNNITSFSQFTINNEAALTIELLDFQALLTDKQTHLAWQVADETLVNHYEIERSYDGKQFEFIKKEAKGKISSTDAPPQYGVIFYRLKIVENDGSWVYSPIRNVNFETLSKTNFKIYPNPATEILNVRFESNSTQNVDFELINAMGQIVYTYQMDSKQGSNHLFFRTANFPAGLYTLRIKQGNVLTTENIVLR